MKRCITLFSLIMVVSIWCNADINTEKTMSRIGRDTKTYLSAEGRAATEQDAFDIAMSDLTIKIADYYKSAYPSEPMPDLVYLSNLSSIFDKLTSRISDKRYRVMVYVKKSDVKALDENTGTVLSLRNAANPEGTAVQTDQSNPTDSIAVENIREVAKTLNPTLSNICCLKTRGEVLAQLPNLKKDGSIEAAAAFPIASFDDFYLIIISTNDIVVSILHYDGKEYTDILTGEVVDISRFSNSSAFWFTLPK